MTIDTTTYDYTLIKADEGKIFKRKGTEELFGEEIALGYSYYIDGVKLDEPHKDVPEDFEEIDIPEGYYQYYPEENSEENKEYVEFENIEDNEVQS